MPDSKWNQAFFKSNIRMRKKVPLPLESGTFFNFFLLLNPRTGGGAGNTACSGVKAQRSRQHIVFVVEVTVAVSACHIKSGNGLTVLDRKSTRLNSSHE